MSRRNRKIPARIPKPIRCIAADNLATAITAAVDSNSNSSWIRLMCFGPIALGVLSTDASGPRPSLASKLRENLNQFSSMPLDQLLTELETPNVTPNHTPKRSVNEDERLKARVRAKLIDGDVSAAVRVVSSSDSIASPTDDVIDALRLKHPPGPEFIRAPDAKVSSTPITISSIEIGTAIKSFPGSSSGGIDGLRPGHLRDLTSLDANEAGSRLRQAISKLVSLLMEGSLNDFARDLLLASSLTALRKKDGGLRPIAVGNVFRRIASKIASRIVSRRLAQELRPVQLGVGVRGGAEAACHAVREYMQQHVDDDRLLVKLDMRNAFNSVNRAHILETCARRCPEISKLAGLSYGRPSTLLIGNTIISSSTGVQQGDPLGPLLFALSVDDIARSARCELNVWYLDDATLGGPADTVTDDLRRILPALSDIGLVVNPSKSEIIHFNTIATNDRSPLFDILPGARLIDRNSVELLGAPLLGRATSAALHAKTERLRSMAERLKAIDRHSALFLLRNYFAMPKLLYTLRSSPCFLDQEGLDKFDRTLRDSLVSICNVDLDDAAWTQATLPIRSGGLGVRSASDLALPAYLSSVSSSEALVGEILRCDGPTIDGSTAISRWKTVYSSTPVDVTSQQAWDNIACLVRIDHLRPQLNQHRLACLTAAAQPTCGAWLEAIPSSSTGTLLDDETARLAIAHRLGLRVCQPHPCRCGGTVDELGLHPLSCRRSAGRFPRHTALNDIIKRAFDASGLPSCLEPVGLDRGDGKRPDGLTLFPFANGRSLIWDATCVDTFSAAHINNSATQPGQAAAKAEKAKTDKYASLSDRFLFQPVAVETSGVLGPSTFGFLKSLGSRIGQARGEPREREWLFQRISLAIVRGNSIAVTLAGQSPPSNSA